MTKTIIAIGGGEIGRIKIHEDGHHEQKPIETMAIDKKILELTGKQNPTIVFIGAASGDNPAYFEAVKNHFQNHFDKKYQVTNLKLSDAQTRPTIDEIRKIIMNTDIVYVGGGNVSNLMKALHESGTDKILRNAYDNGIIMSGNSAGGCVWFEFYGNDEDDDFDGTFETLRTKRALGFIPGYFEPHWNTKNETGIDKESVSKKSVDDMLKHESISGYGVDEGAAIMVQTNNGEQIITEITSKPGARVYRLNQDTQNIYVKMNQTER